MKSKNIKIKHRKYNLYNKKKSKGRQALTIILTIVIVLALGVIGFGLGRPLMEYFQGQSGNNSSSSNMSSSIPDSSSSSDTVTTTESKTETSEPVESTPDEEKDPNLLMLTTTQLKSTESLKAAVSAAKTKGYTGVVATLKNNRGEILYKTDIAGIKDSDAVSGTLTAKQVVDAITSAGLTPYARIYTLRDPVSGAYIPDSKYTTSDGFGWLDDAPASGGKSWLCPFNNEAVQYIADITKELTAAGFKRVVLADTMYPSFHAIDYTYLSHLPISDEKARAEALWNVIDANKTAAKTNNADVLIELNATDIDLADRQSTTAELMNDRDKLKNVELLISYTPDNANAYSSAKSFVGKMKGVYSNVQFSVLVKGVPANPAVQDAIKAFTEFEITVFSE